MDTVSFIDLTPAKRFFSLPAEQIASRFVASQLGTPLLVVASSLPLISIHFFPHELPFKVSIAISGACLVGAIAIHLSYQAVIALNNNQPFDMKAVSHTTRKLLYLAVKYFNLINTSTLTLYLLQRAELIQPILVSTTLVCIISCIVSFSLFILVTTLKHYFPEKSITA